MSVSEAVGDLFDRSTWVEDYPYPAEVDAIGHGVNCQGAMGSGIAVAFRERFPLMYGQYNSLCKVGWLLPGQVFPFRVSKDFYVFNIASQFNPGRDGNLDFLRMGLLYCRFYMQQHGLQHLALPRIGAGIAGLDWNDVKNVVHDVFDDDSGCVDNQPHVTLVSLEGA